MRIFAFFLLGIFLISLQVTLFQALPEWVGMPDLLFLLIVFMAINFKVSQGAFLVLVFGTMYEVFSGYFLGIYAFAFLLIFFVTKGLSVALAIDESNHQPPIVAIGYLMANGLVYLFSVMLISDISISWTWGGILQRVLILVVLVVPFNRLFGMVMTVCDHKSENRSFMNRKKGNRYKSYS